jgi:preprotein translocase subunit YajC
MQNQGASFIFIALIFAFFYFLIIRPQRRRMNDLQSLQRSLELGDEVVTIGGILGTIRRFDGDIVTLELSPGTEARVNRRAISARVDSPASVEEPGVVADGAEVDHDIDQERAKE